MDDPISPIFPVEGMKKGTQQYQKSVVVFGWSFGHHEETTEGSYQHTGQAMAKSGNIVSYTAEELEAMREKGLSRSDFSRTDAMTEEELQEARENDPTAALTPTPEEWDSLIVEPPLTKEPISLRIDADVIAWFKSTGKGYQTRINSVLRTYMKAHKDQH